MNKKLKKSLFALLCLTLASPIGLSARHRRGNYDDNNNHDRNDDNRRGTGAALLGTAAVISATRRGDYDDNDKNRNHDNDNGHRKGRRSRD